MVTVVIWASGYPFPYGNDAAETKSITARTWLPSSKDFKVVATNSSTSSFGAKDFDELLKAISKQPVGSIEKLGIIAHSNKDMIGLAGKIIITPGGDCEFSPAGIINTTVLQAKAPDSAKVTDRFAANASITLFSCNAGAGMSLLIGFQTAFGVDCYGFTDEVSYCPKFSAGVVTERWWVAYARIPPKTQELIDLKLIPDTYVCDQAKNSIWNLQPDSGFFSRN